MSAKDTKAKEFYPTTRDLQNFSKELMSVLHRVILMISR